MHLRFRPWLFFSLVWISAVADASEPSALAPEKLLSKLSYVLTGRNPTTSDINAFKQSIRDHPEDFSRIYATAIDRYLSSPAYPERITRLHQSWWRLPAGTVGKLAGSIVAENLPYSEIYSRNYIFVDDSIVETYQGENTQTLFDLESRPGPPIKIPLAPTEKRFRGLFSSPEFLATYPDTETNKNRKRSGQVFRIAFCESLRNNQFTALHQPRVGLEEEHGQNPDCIGCHRRLDPMARFFDQWRPLLPSGGLLNYDPLRLSEGTVYIGGESGMERALAGRGDGDLGALIVKQPEFASCVSRLAWQYVFGLEVPLNEPFQRELNSQYAASERFNDLVRKSLQHPYFWSTQEPPSLNYGDVKIDFLGCGDCHRTSRLTQFDPLQYPFQANPEANASLLARIWSALNHRDGFRPMPETPRPQLPQESLDRMRSWISSGAQDGSGSRTITEEQIEEILQ